MLGFGKKQKNANKGSQESVNPKHRFEKPYDNHQSDWRKPQGIYATDVDAHKRLDSFYGKVLMLSQLTSLVLMAIIFLGMSYMLLFGNFENVVMDDGSRLFCTILADGSIGIAY